MSCIVCSAAGTETFSNGDALPHSYGEVVDEKYLASPATCTTQAGYFLSCLTCALAYEDIFYAGDLAPHTTEPVLETEATCAAPATYRDVCDLCGHSSEPYASGEAAPHADSDGDCLCDTCSADLSDGAVGILGATADRVVFRVEGEMTEVILCIAAYDGARMTGIRYLSITPEPGALQQVTFDLSGESLTVFLLHPATFAPLYPAK